MLSFLMCHMFEEVLCQYNFFMLFVKKHNYWNESKKVLHVKLVMKMFQETVI